MKIDTKEQFSDMVDAMSNIQKERLWLITSAIVGLVGLRAEKDQMRELELACIDFLQRMHDLTGVTCQPPEKRRRDS